MTVRPNTESTTAFLNILSTAVTSGISFVTLPLFTRLLGTEGFGIVSLYSTWAGVVTILIGLRVEGSIGTAAVRLTSKEQEEYHGSIMLFGVFIFFVLLAIFLVWGTELSGLLGLETGMAFLVLVQALGMFLVSCFSMRNIFRKKSFSNFVIAVNISLSTTVLALALIQQQPLGLNPPYGRTIGWAIPNMVVGVGLMACFFVRKRPTVKLKYLRFALPMTVPLVFHALSQMVLGQSDRVMLDWYLGAKELGVYSFATTITSLLIMAYGAMNSAFVPFMYEDLAKKNDSSTKISHFKNYFILFTLGVTVFCFVSGDLLRITSPAEYWQGTDVLPLLIVGQYFVFLYSFPVNYEFFLGKTSAVAIGTTCSAALNVVLNLWLIPTWGIKGASAATLLSYVALFLFHFAIARYLLADRHYPTRMYLYGSAWTASMSGLSWLLRDTYVVRWMIAALFIGLAVHRIRRVGSVF